MAQRQAPLRYVTAPVTRGAVAVALTATGTVNPVTVVEVGTYVSGPIVRWSCDYNTQVTVGQLCAQIDPRPFQMIADQAAANLAVARAPPCIGRRCSSRSARSPTFCARSSTMPSCSARRPPP
jgi:HlyD family secretion protein